MERFLDILEGGERERGGGGGGGGGSIRECREVYKEKRVGRPDLLEHRTHFQTRAIYYLTVASFPGLSLRLLSLAV